VTIWTYDVRHRDVMFVAFGLRSLRYGLPKAIERTVDLGGGLRVVMVGLGAIDWASPLAELGGTPAVSELKATIRSAIFGAIGEAHLSAQLVCVPGRSDGLRSLTAILGEGCCQEVLVVCPPLSLRARKTGGRIATAAAPFCRTRTFAARSRRRWGAMFPGPLSSDPGAIRP
jgi:hypothetical protein